MKSKLFFLFLFAAIFLTANPALASTMKTYNYPEISMEAPAALDVKKWDFKDDFPTAGCCYLGAKQISAMVLVNKFPDLSSIQEKMVKLTGVSLGSWTLTDQASKDARGWVWRQEYQTIVGDKAVSAVLGHGINAAYLIILCADKNDSADFAAWHKSIRVGQSLKSSSSTRGKPR